MLNDEIKFSIENNETIAARDVSVKDEIMEDVWKIEDDYECV